MCFLSAELGLVVAAPYLPRGLANHVFSPMFNRAHEVWFYDAGRSLGLMLPNLSIQDFTNGYWFRHFTDEHGFRNPPDTPKKTLLLGDSMIYGFGADVQDTAAHLLRTQYGRAVYNMARPADCLYQNYVLLRAHLPEFQGVERVIVFVFINDPFDILAVRPGSLVYAMPELTDPNYAALTHYAHHPPPRPPPSLLHRLSNLHTVRLYTGLRDLPSLELPGVMFSIEDDAAERGLIVAPYLQALQQQGTFAAASQYYRRVIADLHRRLQARGIKLQLVHLETLGALPEGVVEFARLGALVSQVCRQNELQCFTTKELFAGCSDCYLPGDGHFTLSGHRRLAGFVDGIIGGQQEPNLPPRVIPPFAPTGEPPLVVP